MKKTDLELHFGRRVYEVGIKFSLGAPLTA